MNGVHGAGDFERLESEAVCFVLNEEVGQPEGARCRCEPDEWGRSEPAPRVVEGLNSIDLAGAEESTKRRIPPHGRIKVRLHGGILGDGGHVRTC